MVFTSFVNFVRSRGPDEIWRKRKILKLSAHFFGRRRNCYSIAIRNVHRALVYATKGRKLKKQDHQDLWMTRIEAGVQEHHMKFPLFKEALARNDILLNRKTLANLACWEPFTFKSLVNVAQQTVDEQGIVITKNKGLISGGPQPKSFQRLPPEYEEDDESKK